MIGVRLNYQVVGFRARVRVCRMKGDDEQGVGSKDMLD